MENKNGVIISRENCDLCMCKNCGRKATGKLNFSDKIKCPYLESPYSSSICYSCDKKEYIKECVFYHCN